MFNESDFQFNKEETELLFWLKYWCVIKEINQKQNIGLLTSLFSDDNKANMKSDLIKNLKGKWLSEWSQTTRQLLNISDKLTSDEVKNEFSNKKFSAGKIRAFIVEVASFTPYFPLEQNSKEYKSLEFTSESYSTEAASLMNAPKANLIKTRKTYEKSAELISKKISGNSNTWAWVALGSAVLLICAPYLAGAIGGFMGLSGAAATSAGLAFLGGGSIAAGGFGMAGGYMVAMAGGAIIGYSRSDSKYKDSLHNASQEELLISCAKLISILSLNTDDKLSLTKSLCESALDLQYDLEKFADINFMVANKKSTEVANKAHKKAQVIAAFRSIIRSN